MAADQQQHPTEARHEARDVDPRYVTAIATSLFGALAVSVAVLWMTLGQGPRFAAATPLRSPTLELEVSQPATLEAYLRDQQMDLDRLSWNDDQHLSAKVPIGAAIDLLAKSHGGDAP